MDLGFRPGQEEPLARIGLHIPGELLQVFRRVFIEADAAQGDVALARECLLQLDHARNGGLVAFQAGGEEEVSDPHLAPQLGGGDVVAAIILEGEFLHGPLAHGSRQAGEISGAAAMRKRKQNQTGKTRAGTAKPHAHLKIRKTPGEPSRVSGRVSGYFMERRLAAGRGRCAMRPRCPADSTMIIITAMTHTGMTMQ